MPVLQLGLPLPGHHQVIGVIWGKKVIGRRRGLVKVLLLMLTTVCFNSSQFRNRIEFKMWISLSIEVKITFAHPYRCWLEAEWKWLALHKVDYFIISRKITPYASSLHVVIKSTRPNNSHITKLVWDEGVSLHSLAELVCLTADQNWHVEGPGYQSYLRCAHTRHHVAISQQSMGTQEHLRYLGEGEFNDYT